MLTYPLCLIGGCIDDVTTDAEIIHCARIQLDLIEEGQDGTEEYTRRDITEIRRFLHKHGGKER